MDPEVAAGVAAAAVAAVHGLARVFERVLDVVPRSRWLSAGSGISLAYVFVHLLPEIAAGQQRLAERRSGGVATDGLWLGALAGLVLFYGLERLATNRSEQRGDRHLDARHDAAGWLHLGSYGLYNALAGYLLLEQAHRGHDELTLYTLAIGLHFVVNDQGLADTHGQLHRRVGRWLLAAAVVGGWLLSLGDWLAEVHVWALLAFLGGGIILNVLKEELPDERRSRFVTLALAATGYAALLTLV